MIPRINTRNEGFLPQATRENSTPVPAPRQTSLPEALDRALDLSGGAKDLLQNLQTMSREDQDAFLKSLTDLLRHGVVGYEYRRINGEPQKVFIDVAIGSDLHRAPLVRGDRFDRMI
ncbi:MAG: hypothetical protein O2954_05745 [bacterium]|nr:hypothetical protein [bacterium]